MSSGAPKARRRERPGIWIAAAAAAVVACALAAAALRYAPMFEVSDVAVTGAADVKASDIIDAAALNSDTPLLTAPLDEIAARVEGIDAIADAEVTRDWPNGLTIEVRERRPAGFVRTAQGAMLVGSDGAFYSQVSEVPDELPELPNVESTNVGASYRSQLNSADIAALEVASSLPPRLQRSLKRVGAQSPEEVVLVFEDGVEVKWGSVAATDTKADVVLALRAHRGWAKEFSLVDVTVPEAPALT